MSALSSCCMECEQASVRCGNCIARRVDLAIAARLQTYQLREPISDEELQRRMQILSFNGINQGDVLYMAESSEEKSFSDDFSDPNKLD